MCICKFKSSRIRSVRDFSDFFGKNIDEMAFYFDFVPAVYRFTFLKMVVLAFVVIFNICGLHRTEVALWMRVSCAGVCGLYAFMLMLQSLDYKKKYWDYGWTARRYPALVDMRINKIIAAVIFLFHLHVFYYFYLNMGSDDAFDWVYFGLFFAILLYDTVAILVFIAEYFLSAFLPCFLVALGIVLVAFCAHFLFVAVYLVGWFFWREKKEDSGARIFNFDGKNRDVCAICMIELEKRQTVLRMDCDRSHIFHIECAMNWLSIQKKCPICRKPFLLTINKAKKNQKR